MSEETHLEIIRELESVKKDLKTLKVISTCLLIMVFLLQIQNLFPVQIGPLRVMSNSTLKTINSFRKDEFRWLIASFSEGIFPPIERIVSWRF